MAKINFTKLGLKTSNEVTTFEFNGQTVEVLKYLSSKEKYNLIQSVLNATHSDAYGDSFQEDVIFHLYLIYAYTNLLFTEKQKEDPYKLYDMFATSGFLEAFVAAMDDDEYELLIEAYRAAKEERKERETNLIASLSELIGKTIPDAINNVMSQLNDFDPTKFERLMTFAQALGMNNGG